MTPEINPRLWAAEVRLKAAAAALGNRLAANRNAKADDEASQLEAAAIEYSNALREQKPQRRTQR